MKNTKILGALLIGGIGSTALSAIVDQRRLTKADASSDWLSYGRTYSEQRFSPLKQVNEKSVAKLGLTWWSQFDTNRGQEATPLEADGVLYTTTAWSKVFAFDARTGKQLWKYDPKAPGPVGLSACCDVVNRGAALWNDKVYVGTIDGRLIALDAKTGLEKWSSQTTDPKLPYTITGAPRIVKGLVLIGNGGAEYGVRGYLSAYDAETGKLAWRFYVTPNPDGKPDNAASDKALAEKANSTWAGDVWKTSGGGGTPWDAITYDPVADLVYIGTGNGAPWNHHIRSQGEGDNLFLSSIVAVKPETGEYVWHYQTTPGDTWDYTAVQQITVADIMIRGRKRHVVMQAPKNGFFYVLDARSGELLSAEKYFLATDWAYSVDMRTGRPVERIGTRWGAGSSSLQNPSPSGAHSWKAMAYSPLTGLVYIPILDAVFRYSAVNPADYRHIDGVWNTGGGVQGIAPGAQGVPGAMELSKELAKRPPRAPVPSSKGMLTAFDPSTGKIRWNIDHSGSDWGLGGVMVTGGNLVFQGVKHDLKAYNATTGKEVWSYDLGNSAIAPPMTYALGNIQYVAIMVGNGGGNGEGNSSRTDRTLPGRLMVFKLGGDAKPTPYSSFVKPLVDTSKAEPSSGDVTDGRIFYGRYCGSCHGQTPAYPDLRRSQVLLSKDRFKAIVHGGVLASSGMVSFSKYMDEQQVEAIRAFLVKTYATPPVPGR
ncbi:PQQ-dependent dehydrogenase, methanol/ethanol family [Glacieibacterium sp.]|uniref:PQQ-dependent dehydrogenase, methanol/ethanol family n=1 Tax=Glacieibacterium sp. TaxID=2860237 RepID=UPI003AFFB01F